MQPLSLPQNPPFIHNPLSAWISRLLMDGFRVADRGKRPFIHASVDDRRLDHRRLHLRRFLQHNPPKGFHRIRHYGLLASGTRRSNLEHIPSRSNGA